MREGRVWGEGGSGMGRGRVGYGVREGREGVSVSLCYKM